VGWFDDVPDGIRIGDHSFLVAGEAIENWESRLMGSVASAERGARPDPDWPATGLFLLARLQLDQAIEILMSEFGIDARLLSVSDVYGRLHDSISSVQGGAQAAEDFAYEIDVLSDAVGLWRALRETSDQRVHHAFEYDGSITLTLGPQLPDLYALDIRPGDGNGLMVSPAELFSAATNCTNCAAELAVRFRTWASQGYVPESGNTTPQA
jgi:hypothetical protein